jgi:hypothetical protein
MAMMKQQPPQRGRSPQAILKQYPAWPRSLMTRRLKLRLDIFFTLRPNSTFQSQASPVVTMLQQASDAAWSELLTCFSRMAKQFKAKPANIAHLKKAKDVEQVVEDDVLAEVSDLLFIFPGQMLIE